MAHQNERALGKQLRASIYGVDGPAVRDESQLVKIMRVDFYTSPAPHWCRTPHPHRLCRFSSEKCRSSTSLISAPPFFCYYNASKKRNQRNFNSNFGRITVCSRPMFKKLRNALEFTRVYKENANDIYLREAACMDFQLRHILVPMDENDGIAGRYEHDFVGFSSQVGGIYTYYFNEHEFLNAYMACKQNGEITAAEDYALQAVQALLARGKHRAQG